jgi:hypothetical protein
MTDDVPFPEADLIAVASELEELKSRGLREELSDGEIRRLLELSRVLRRTTAGPAKAKTAKKKKGPMTDDDLNSLLG